MPLFASQAIPSMRPSTTTEKPLVLGQGPPSSPGSSRNSTPHSAGGLRTGGFGPPPSAFAPAYETDAYGAPPQQRSSQHASRSGSPGGGGRRASAVSLGGARRSKHADGRPREWDESSSSEGDE